MIYRAFYLLKFLMSLNLNTIRFNFKYFNFKTAIKFPVIVSTNVLLKNLSGTVLLDFTPSRGKVLLGYGEVGIFDKKNSRSIWEVNSGKVIFKGNANLGHGFKLSINHGKVQFGDNFRITAESTIVCKEASVIFGYNNLLSWDILILTSDFHSIYNRYGDRINHPENIIFGNDIWVGCRNTILKGTKIPDGCVIAANSLLSKEYDSKNSIIGGNPAAVLKTKISW